MDRKALINHLLNDHGCRIHDIKFEASTEELMQGHELFHMASNTMVLFNGEGFSDHDHEDLPLYIMEPIDPRDLK